MDGEIAMTVTVNPVIAIADESGEEAGRIRWWGRNLVCWLGRWLIGSSCIRAETRNDSCVCVSGAPVTASGVTLHGIRTKLCNGAASLCIAAAASY